MPSMPSMPPESAPGSAGLDHPGVRPGDPWPADEPRGEPDPDWPDDWPDDDQAGPSWPGIPPPARGGGGIPGRRARALAAVAVVALAAGAGVAVAVGRGLSSSPAAAQTPGSSQPQTVPGGNAGGVPPGAFPGSGQVGQLILGGTVTAVSSTSITIAGGSHTVTAAITNSTKVTGKVTSIGAVKVGDLVTAEITESGGTATATAIQDPASLPSGGGLPSIGGTGP
jgi:hypothetical protein